MLAELEDGIRALAEVRAAILLAAHERVRIAMRTRKVQHRVEPLLAADVIGIYVLMPANV